MEYVIVGNEFGDIRVYPATLDTAKAMVDNVKDNVSSQVVELSTTNSLVRSKEAIFRTINKILSSADGEMVTRTIKSTNEQKQEIIMYCFNHNLAIKNNKIESMYDFFKHFKLSDFACFTNNESYPNDLIVTYQEYIDQAQIYRAVVHDNWSAGVTDKVKITRMLEFVNSLSHRDVNYSLIQVRNYV